MKKGKRGGKDDGYDDCRCIERRRSVSTKHMPSSTGVDCREVDGSEREGRLVPRRG